MIDLHIQIKLIIFSFIFGFLFSAIVEIVNNKVKKCKSYVKVIMTFFIVLFSTIIYFEGINRVGNAIFHMYSILSIIIGFISYDLLLRIIENNSKK